MQANLQAIQNAQMQLQSLSESHESRPRTAPVLERQLTDIEATRRPCRRAAWCPMPVTAAGRATAEQLDAGAARYCERCESRFKPDHPDVMRAEAADSGSRGKGRGRDAAVGRIRRRTAPSRWRQPRWRGGTGSRDLQGEPRGSRSQLASKQARNGGCAASSPAIRPASMPRRRANPSWSELTRDYDTLQNIYTSLLAKREDSKMAANLERRQIGEQFKILDPARVPGAAVQPEPAAHLNAGRRVSGLASASRSSGSSNIATRRSRREDDVVRLLELPVLALVPMMASDARARAASSPAQADRAGRRGVHGRQLALRGCRFGRGGF